MKPSEENGSSLEILMVGNFNFSQINWDTRKVHGGTRQNASQIMQLLNLVEEYKLKQHIQTPTRMNNIHDLVLTQNQDTYITIKYMEQKHTLKPCTTK